MSADFDVIVVDETYTAGDVVIATGSDPVIQPFPIFSEVFLHALQELGAKQPASAPA